MIRWPVDRSSIFAASALTLLCGTVFATLQDYGPESSLRLFHEAIVRRDPGTFARVVEPGLDDPDTQFSVAVVQRVLIQQGARFRISRMDRKPAWVGAQVEYIAPSGQISTVYWVVRKENRIWRVDARETWRAMHRN